MTRLRTLIRFIIFRQRGKYWKQRVERIKRRVREIELEKQLARNYWSVIHGQNG